MANPCWYTLVLRYGTNRFYLAPRASITIDEGNDLESQDDSSSGCAGCGSPTNRSWKFKAYFDGACDLSSAWTLFNQLQAFLDAACAASADITIERTVCNETPLVYQVKKANLRMTDTHLQRIAKPRQLVMEIKLELAAWVQTGEGAVLVGA